MTIPGRSERGSGRGGHASVRAVTRRRLLGAASAGALGLFAVACTRESWPGGEFADLGAAPELVRGSESLLALDELGDADRLLLPGARLRLEATALVESFTAGELSVLTSRSARTDTPADHEVPAPDGCVFLVAAIDVDYAALVSLPAPVSEDGGAASDGGGSTASPADADEEPVVAILLADGEGEVLRTEIAPLMSRTRYLMRVPSSPTAQDAILEVVVDGAVQRMSLVDGTLLHTDVPHVYDRRGTVTLTDAEDATGGVETDDGERDALQLFLDGSPPPCTSTGVGGRAWACRSSSSTPRSASRPRS